MKWQDGEWLQQDERIRASWTGENLRERTQMKMGSYKIPARESFRGKEAYMDNYETVPEKVTETHRGILILTNRRLVWLDEVGLLRKSYSVAEEIPLDALRGVSMGGKDGKSIEITDFEGDWTFRLKTVGNDEQFNEFKQTVESKLSP